MSQPNLSFKSFSDFYPFYLSEHSNKTCKQLHFIGTCGVLAVLTATVVTGNLMLLWLAPLAGYSFAWVGHFVFEKNRPASFKHPLYSFMGDCAMFWHLLTGKLSFADNAKLKN